MGGANKHDGDVARNGFQVETGFAQVAATLGASSLNAVSQRSAQGITLEPFAIGEVLEHCDAH